MSAFFTERFIFQKLNEQVITKGSNFGDSLEMPLMAYNAVSVMTFITLVVFIAWLLRDHLYEGRYKQDEKVPFHATLMLGYTVTIIFIMTFCNLDIRYSEVIMGQAVIKRTADSTTTAPSSISGSINSNHSLLNPVNPISPLNPISPISIVRPRISK